MGAKISTDQGIKHSKIHILFVQNSGNKDLNKATGGRRCPWGIYITNYPEGISIQENIHYNNTLIKVRLPLQLLKIKKRPDSLLNEMF